MANVNVDVDLDEFDFDDLLIEVISRLKRASKFKNHRDLTDNHEQLLELGVILSKTIKRNCIPAADNLADEMKNEFMSELSQRYSEDKLREMDRLFSKLKIS